MERPKDLPDYDDPPIDEVALGVQFDAIAGFAMLTQASSGIACGIGIHDSNRNPQPTFPLIEDLARPPSPIQRGLSFEPGVMPSRTWLITADDSELLRLSTPPEI